MFLGLGRLHVLLDVGPLFLGDSFDRRRKGARASPASTQPAAIRIARW